LDNPLPSPHTDHQHLQLPLSATGDWNELTEMRITGRCDVGPTRL
jgi:hypothetical protein